MTAVYSAAIENMSFMPLHRSVTIDDEKDFRAKLRAFDIGEAHVALLFARILQNLSFEDIVKEQGWVNADAARYRYRSVIKELKRKGYK